MTITITATNADVVNKSLENFSGKIMLTVKQHIRNVAESASRKIQNYPTQSAWSTYVRTYQLKEGWKIGAVTNGYKISNTVPYTSYVVGNEHGLEQAWMHVGTWSLVREVVNDEVTKAPDEIIKGLLELARQEGL